MLKRKTLYPLGLLSVIILTMLFAFSVRDKSNFEVAKQEVVLRKVGHQLLLQAGDSTSRVLPVRKIGENEYRITFENEFTFTPDSLVSLVKQNLRENYVVNVVSCAEKAVVYGFAILKNVRDDIIACTGREQPKSCYYIDIKFEDSGISNTQKGYLLGGLPLLAFVVLMATKKTSRKTQLQQANTISIGQTLFNPSERKLIFARNSISLTVKETKLLLILATSPNMIIERSRFQKELWEDEGVIVGRSLDVFISRLRKKLESDECLQIINIHNKGYKLAIH
jgi:DNA-binding winged helix-turn-helix (wHTH) protein